MREVFIRALAGLMLLPMIFALIGCAAVQKHDDTEPSATVQALLDELEEISEVTDSAAKSTDPGAVKPNGTEKPEATSPPGEPKATDAAKPTQAPAVTSTPKPTPLPTATPKPTPTPTPKPTPTPAPTPEPTEQQPVAPTASDASAYIGSGVYSLYAAIGYPPNGSSYASSCLGEGEDGELYYNGFTVYTYRAADGSETVQSVF